VPVRGPFSFQDGAVGWAVAQPPGQSLALLLRQGAPKQSQLAPALGAAARALAAAARAGVLHPEPRPESLFLCREAPAGRLAGFFSWRELSPRLTNLLGPEEPSKYRAPEGTKSEASLAYSLAQIGAEAGLCPEPARAALQEDPAVRPGLPDLAEAYEKIRPGFLARLFGR
jgi:hypothetical protein